MKEDVVSHANEIVRKLEREITLGRLMPGQRLDERSLSEQFRVSRTPVREALQRLGASGLITLRGRQGACVARLSVPDLFDAFYVVAELEGMAARQAARRLRPAQRQRLEESHRRCAELCAANDPDGFYEENLRFHDIIIEGSHNRVLQDQLRALRVLISPYRRHVTYQPGRMADSIPEHQAVMEAIFRNDGEQARELMCQHVSLLSDGLGDLLHALRAAGEMEMLDI